MCADNFFTSVSLCQFLWRHQLRFVGTLRKNQKEVPQEFLPHKHRAANSSLFGFNEYLTMISYVPKKNKAVILVSTAHHDQDINSSTNKPDIIHFYNKKKAGVDSLDQMLEKFSCRRRTNRWTFNLFMYMLDVAAYNAFVLWSLTHQQQHQSNRADSIDVLSRFLVLPNLTRRAQVLPMNISYALKENFRRMGVPIRRFEPIYIFFLFPFARKLNLFIFFFKACWRTCARTGQKAIAFCVIINQEIKQTVFAHIVNSLCVESILTFKK